MSGRTIPMIASALLFLAATARATPLYPPAGLDMSAIDPATRAGDDFFQYANGAWLERTPIPADKPFYTEAQRLRDVTEAQLRGIIESAAATAGHEPTTLEGKVGAFYKAFMDDQRREALGLRPLRAELDAVRTSKTRAQLAALMGGAMGDYGGSLFGINVDVDLKDTAHYAVYINQSGLTLPDRDYYLKPDFAREKREFRDYAARLLTLAHWPAPQVNANAIEALETRIAEASWTKAQQRDLPKTYNPYTPAALQTFAPGFDWADFLRGASLEGKQRVIVAEQSAFPLLARIYADTSLDTLRAWVAFMKLDSAAPYLNRDFADARFHFRSGVLLGIKERPARWKEGILAVAGGDCLAGGACFGTLDWAVGQLYTARYFPPSTKAAIQALAHELIAAYRKRIEQLDWMGPETRAEALRKLDTYVVKVGYPDKPRDYSHVIVRDDDVAGNVRRAATADWQFISGRSNGPVDTGDWFMTPQTMDAYNGSLRDIVFPAAILQAPEFDPDADPAVNYGSVGTIIGHELTHGFDDQGRTLDASGALRDWWTAADAAAFKERAATLGAQYATYEPVAGLHINPELTMGENIADLGGVAIALEAYHAALHGQEAPVIDGLSGDQRFFRAYAQDWRGKGRDDYIRQLTTSDPHSFRKYRVNGVVRNIDGWYEAMHVQPGDKLYVDPDKEGTHMVSRRIAIIDGHPDPDQLHFVHALADAYERGAREAGHEVRRIAVADLKLPLLRSARDFQSGKPGAAVRRCQDDLGWAQHWVILYPLWLGSMPAMLKGFFEQVARPGFAFGAVRSGKRTRKLLAGRSAHVFVTMGMPGFFYRWYYRSHSLKSLERNILAFIGIAPVRSSIVGMVEGVSAAVRKKWLQRARALGARAA